MKNSDDKTANVPSLGEMNSWRGGSGIADFIGHRIIELQPDTAVVELEISRQFTSRDGSVPGGIYSLLMDTAGGYAGVYTTDPDSMYTFVTISLSTNLLGQPHGTKLRATGYKRGGGRSTFFSDVEVRDEQGNLLAIGSGAFRKVPATAATTADP